MQNRRTISERARRGALLALLVALTTAAVGCAGMKVAVTPLQLSLVSGAQVFTQDSAVRGVSLNILAGKQEDVAGFDVGLFNAVDKEFRGIGAGIINLGHGSVRGAQLGLGNTADKELVGMQVSIANQADEKMKGLQAGVGNFTGECKGLQLGVVNMADSTGCVQIGLFNFNPKGFLKFFPILLFGR